MIEAAAPTSVPHRTLHPWEWRVVWLLVLCFALHNLPWRLDDLDQAKQANVSLEMVGAGHWWFQHTPGGKAIATKPPLVGWISAGLHLLPFVGWDVAWRLPSLIAALALAAAMWRCGEILWPGRGGVVALAAFGFNLLTPRLATLVRTDMPLTFVITGVGLIVWHHARDAGRRPWTNRSRWAVFGFLLAGMMTKGPVIFAFLLPGMVAHSWVVRRRGGNWRAAWGGWWHWVLPLVPFLVWALCGILYMPGFYSEVVGKEFFGRFTVGEKAVHHNQPVYFYFTQMLKQWLPWDVLLIALTIRSRRLWAAACGDSGVLWLVCWAAGAFVFMSLVPSKRIDRIFPIVPPLALMVTALLARGHKGEGGSPADGSYAGEEPQDSRIPLEVTGHTLSPAQADVTWPWRWAKFTTGVAVLVGIGSAVYSICLTYVRHDHARASFAARALKLEDGRAIALVTGRKSQETDETMLVYLRQLAFLTPAEAIQRWSTGKLDAIVVSEDVRAELGNLLEPFGPAQPVLETAGSRPEYSLLARPQKATAVEHKGH